LKVFSAASGVGLGVQKPAERKRFQTLALSQQKAVWNRPEKVRMKKLMLLTVAIATITTLSLPAADDAAPKKAKKALSADVIKKHDKDGDGKLNKEEMQAYRAEQKKEKKDAK
jgi:hypothetical protein